MKLAVQLPFAVDPAVFRVVLIMIRRTMVPDNNRIIVKLDASMASLPNAKRHSTELAANAINAKPVRMIILNT